jgi:hypothetical protein
VGKKKPNPWGLYDMHGNVSEWVLDELLKDGYTRFHGKRLTAAEAVVWPTKLFPRVVKGGSWDDEASSLRAAARLGSHDYDWKEDDPNIPLSPWWYTSDPAGGVGFRMIRPLKTTPKREFAKFWDVDCAEMRDDVTIRLEEGRGVIGLVDPDLPKALKELEK